MTTYSLEADVDNIQHAIWVAVEEGLKLSKISGDEKLKLVDNILFDLIVNGFGHLSVSSTNSRYNTPFNLFDKVEKLQEKFYLCDGKDREKIIVKIKKELIEILGLNLE